MTTRQLITPRSHDLGGGFTVRRALPAAACRSVGPFVFFDHFGPVAAASDGRHDVRPHPHIGLATVTYLYEGAMMHRDSTGAVQRIDPGAVNWMKAGRGIVHSERGPTEPLPPGTRNQGLQLWLALPTDAEEDDPLFSHTPAGALPALEVGGARLRVLIGQAFGASSPVPSASPTLFVDVQMGPEDAFPVPLATERALYGVDGGFLLDGEAVPAQTLVVLAPGEEPMVSADEAVRLALVGGDPLGERFLWWNFVSSRQDRITQAADAWTAGQFAGVPGETEFIPLPPR